MALRANNNDVRKCETLCEAGIIHKKNDNS